MGLNPTSVTPIVKVDGVDNGIKTTFRFTKDLFSKTSDQKIINSREYYFLAVAYGYNEFGKYKADKIWSVKDGESYEGQKFPYLQGRVTKRGSGVPHDPKTIGEELLANSIYGFGPKITPPPRQSGERIEPARARPVPFCFQGLRPPPRTSARVLAHAVP